MKLICENICKRFGDKTIYSNAFLEAEEGKIYGLLGRNGVGKTTLLNCISGEDEFDTGKIALIDKGKQYSLADSEVSYVLAIPMLPEFMTGYEFIQFYIEICGKKVTHKADYYLNLVNMDAKDQKRLIRDYSLGMKNKLQLLMPIISQPKVILLDEPLTSFDVVVAEEMKDLLTEMKRDKIILFSTHILQLAEELCDKLILVHNYQLETIEGEEFYGEEGRKNIIKKLQGDNK